jgi:hypothetical protein
MGGDKTAEEAITRLGLQHNLLTAFTSFVAIDSQVVNQGGQGATVKQPLPLPEGVSELAVGNMAYKLGTGAGGGGMRFKRKAADLGGVQGIASQAGAPLSDAIEALPAAPAKEEDKPAAVPPPPMSSSSTRTCTA